MRIIAQIKENIKFRIRRFRFRLNTRHKNLSRLERFRKITLLFLGNILIWAIVWNVFAHINQPRKFTIYAPAVATAATEGTEVGEIHVGVSEGEATKPSPQADIEKLICEVFKEECHIALAVAMAESSMNPQAIGDKHLSQPSYGLFQISRIYHNYDISTLLDPKQNITIAKEISSRGRGWANWKTFRNGQYLQHVDN